MIPAGPTPRPGRESQSNQSRLIIATPPSRAAKHFCRGWGQRSCTALPPPSWFKRCSIFAQKQNPRCRSRGFSPKVCERVASGEDDELPASPVAARQSSLFLSLSLPAHPSTCARQQVSQPSINDSDQLAPIRAALVSSVNSCSPPECRQKHKDPRFRVTVARGAS